MLKKHEAVVTDYAKSLAWYESLTGMLGNLSGISIAPGGVMANSLKFQAAPPLDTADDSQTNTGGTVTVHFNQGHDAVVRIEVENSADVPYNDIAMHAVTTNDWPLFLREYHFRCLNVALTELEVNSTSGESAVVWMGVKNMAPHGFAHLFQAEVASKVIRLAADLEYPQEHASIHHVGDHDEFELVQDCDDEQLLQSVGGSRLLAAFHTCGGSAAEVA